jgi:hypothetical protein
MKVIRLTHLHNLLAMYQEKSNFTLQQVNKRLPKHLLTLAEGLEAADSASANNPVKNTLITQLRCQSEVCEDVTEAIAITNDFVCDKLAEILRKVEASIAK